MKTLFEEYGGMLLAATGMLVMLGIYGLLFISPDGLLAVLIAGIGSGGLLR